MRMTTLEEMFGGPEGCDCTECDCDRERGESGTCSECEAGRHMMMMDEDIKKGAFHRWLGKAEDSPITTADIERGKRSDDPHVRKMANFAKNAKGWKKG
jgi:hypothetical protein